MLQNHFLQDYLFTCSSVHLFTCSPVHLGGQPPAGPQDPPGVRAGVPPVARRGPGARQRWKAPPPKQRREAWRDSVEPSYRDQLLGLIGSRLDNKNGAALEAREELNLVVAREAFEDGGQDVEDGMEVPSIALR